ncbi:MAG: ATP-binding protein [Thermodesulfobacteriota bacterium]
MTELSLHILDLVQNAVEAGASRVEILIEENRLADIFLIQVRDNGKGMSEDQIAKVMDPFFTTRKTRHVGLGLPLLLDACRRCQGDLRIHSRPGEGTTIQAFLQHSHIDRAPLGDMPSVLVTLLYAENPVDWLYLHKVDGREFELDTAEIRKELAEVPITHPKLRKWILDYLRIGEKDLALMDIPLQAAAIERANGLAKETGGRQ